MKRREFITLLGGAAAAWPLAARAQTKRARIGWFTVAPHPYIEGFRRGLKELGWIEGENIVIEHTYADGHPERLPGLASVLARVPYDLVVVSGSDAVEAARAAIQSIPIVAISSTLGMGGSSLARSEGNLSGIALLFDEVANKWLELLVETVPVAQRIAVLFDPSPSDALQLRAIGAPEIAAEFVRLKVDIIVTSGAAGPAVKQATSTIPIVLGLANDPVGEGLVTSLRRPGGNITGLSLQAPDLAGKRLGLLHEILPDVRRLVILVDITYPAAVLEMREAQTTARSLGIEFVTLEIRRADDFAPALEAHKSAADALFVGGGPLMTTNRLRINTLALAAGLPTIAILRENVEAGALMSYGPHFPDLFRRAADYVDMILRGAKPAELPIEQPTKFELVINLKTAKALGLTIPESFLMRADEVIE